MKKHRYLVWAYCAVLAWVIVDIARMELEKESELVALCALSGQHKMPKLSPASPSARAAVKWIASTAGVAPNFDIYAGSVSGVALAAFRNNRRVIVYDKRVIQWGKNAARWREMFVIAHEVGHHLGGHIFIEGANAHAQELEADRFAGYVLALLGASRDQALSFSNEFTLLGAASHPPRDKRRAAITAGWRRGRAVRAAP